MDSPTKNHYVQHKHPQNQDVHVTAKKQDGFKLSDNDDACPFDEGLSSSLPSSSSHVPTALVLNLKELVQTPTNSTEEGDAIGTVTKLMSEMKVLLDTSPCHTPTPMKYRNQQDVYTYSTPCEQIETTTAANKDPAVVIKLSLLKQIANATNTNHAASCTAACDGQHALVPASFLLRACQVLVDEREEMVEEALSLMESVREEAIALRSRSRDGGVQII
mmetsp:Transcript_1225/g.2187  ORF Transcript_1225/g.2187 Transcript_1225/m.2187 type:complete len:219 (-) Transcript_1225:2034-2690(-)